ncbi:LuxR C-terminal-related transcriptional regulator [Acidisoma sp. 7E03]
MDQSISHVERSWPVFGASDINSAQPEGAGDSFAGVKLGAADLPAEEWSDQYARIGWIDSFALTRDCILKVLSATQPRLVIRPFASAEELLAVEVKEFDVVVLHSHDSYEACLEEITKLREAAPHLPVVILSDLEESGQINTVRGALRAGASGFISTRSMGLGMTLSAIRFVQSGGTFAPVDLLLSEPAPAAPPPEDNEFRLTSRQRDVLAQLQQGKANKIIAHELGMSESTAKVHIRNIMRKMGATNRTQAAFNALKLYPMNEHRSGA